MEGILRPDRGVRLGDQQVLDASPLARPLPPSLPNHVRSSLFSLRPTLKLLCTSYLATDSSTALKLLSSSLPPEWYTLTLATIPHPTLSSLAPTTPYNQPTFSTLPLSYRIALTRGMMVDFSLLVGGWGSGIDSATEEEYEAVGMGEKEYRRRRKVVAVVCALASDVCKLAAVGLGWEMGVEKGRWVNVDGAEDFDWRPTEIM